MSSIFASIKRKQDHVSDKTDTLRVLKHKAEIQNNTAVIYFIEKVSLYFLPNSNGGTADSNVDSIAIAIFFWPFF
jgi:hypothetical protein